MTISRPTFLERPEIERQLRLRLVPRTENRDALIELGFTPAYPQLADDEYYGAIWTRAVEAVDDCAPGRGSALRRLVVERAFHVRAVRRTRRTRWRRADAYSAATLPWRAYLPLSAERFRGVARVTSAPRRTREAQC